MTHIIRKEDFTAPAWTGDLCNTWGATSLHAEVFRKPQGVRWVHCFECYSPSTPSGTRSHVAPAAGPTQMEVVCRMAQAAARGEGNPLFEVFADRPAYAARLTGVA